MVADDRLLSMNGMAENLGGMYLNLLLDSVPARSRTLPSGMVHHDDLGKERCSLLCGIIIGVGRHITLLYSNALARGTSSRGVLLAALDAPAPPPTSALTAAAAGAAFGGRAGSALILACAAM